MFVLSSGTYTAVIECVCPAGSRVLVDSVAVLPVMPPMPIDVPPSSKVTVPASAP